MGNQTKESGQQTNVIRQITTLQEEQMNIPKEFFDLYGRALVRVIITDPLNGKKVSDTLYDPKDYPLTD